MDRIVSVSSMAFDGYPFETALDELAALGVRYVEPASVDKVFQHLVEDDFREERARSLRVELVHRKLACLSLSAHMDLTQPDSVDRFRRRLDFARTLGAKAVNTIAGPLANREGFQRNIALIARHAADLGIVVALENHGDLLDRGRQLLDFIREVDSPAVRLNYDTGNAYYYSKGTVDAAAELAEIAPAIAHVHVKTPQVDDGMLRWVALGDGLLNLQAVAKVLKEQLPGVPVSYELSPRQRSRNFEPRWRTEEIPDLADIRRMIRTSLDALARALA
jgi:sugar phosphate isomerase/epimerase